MMSQKNLIRVVLTQRDTTQIQDAIPQVDEAPEDPHTDVVNPLVEVSSYWTN